VGGGGRAMAGEMSFVVGGRGIYREFGVV
jgi:hypothetical protein